jgi:hypothetical protein
MQGVVGEGAAAPHRGAPFCGCDLHCHSSQMGSGGHLGLLVAGG